MIGDGPPEGVNSWPPPVAPANAPVPPVISKGTSNSKPVGVPHVSKVGVWVEIVPALNVKVVNSSPVWQPLSRKVLISVSCDVPLPARLLVTVPVTVIWSVVHESSGPGTRHVTST